MSQEKRYEERYYLEQRFIPQCLFSDECQRFIIMLMEHQGAFLIEVLNEIGKENGYECPYSEEDFSFFPQLIAGEKGAPDIAMLVIEMPVPERMLLCSRVYIITNKELKEPQYFTVEKSIGDSYMLCGVDKEGRHLNYGGVPFNETILIAKLYEMYCNRGND